jgi:hypothetical protein
MGQWKEQMPHCTQRTFSGTTHPATSASCRVFPHLRLARFAIRTSPMAQLDNYRRV